MRYVVFLKNGKNKPITANAVEEGYDFVKFYNRTEEYNSFWKGSCITYETVAYFNRLDILGYEKIFGE